MWYWKSQSMLYSKSSWLRKIHVNPGKQTHRETLGILRKTSCSPPAHPWGITVTQQNKAGRSRTGQGNPQLIAKDGTQHSQPGSVARAWLCFGSLSCERGRRALKEQHSAHWRFFLARSQILASGTVPAWSCCRAEPSTTCWCSHNKQKYQSTNSLWSPKF